MQNDIANRNVFHKQFNKFLVLYAVWSIIYLLYSIPIWIHEGEFSVHIFVNYAINTVLTRSYNHLWYLLSAIYALPLLFFFLKNINTKYIPAVAFILYLFRVVMRTYQIWLPSNVIQVINMLEKIGALLSAADCILPFFLIGVFIKNYGCGSRRKNLICFMLSFFMLCVEALVLLLNGQYAVAYIIFTFPTAYFLFRLIVGWKIQKYGHIYDLLGRASIMIYCCHPIIIFVTNRFVHNSACCFIITVIISTFASIVFNKIMDIRRQENNLEVT